MAKIQTLKKADDMDYQALIIENDEDSAQMIKKQLELNTNIKCTITFELLDIQRQLQTNPEIEYVFLFYDVSDEVEQIREQNTKTYIVTNYPWVQIYSIGSLKQEAVTITDRKVFIFNTNNIVNLIKECELLNQDSNGLRV